MTEKSAVDELIEILKTNPPEGAACIFTYKNHSEYDKAVIILNLSPSDTVMLFREGIDQVIFNTAEELLSELVKKK